MTKALQRLWVRRCDFGLIAVVLVTSALLLTFVIAVPDAPGCGHVALSLPATVFALLTPAGVSFNPLQCEEPLRATERFLPAISRRGPPA